MGRCGNFTRALCFAAALLPLHAVAERPAAPDAYPLTEANLRAFFDSALNAQVQEHEIVGAVVSVVKDGEVLFKTGYGFADLEERIPADPDQSIFRIASISKPFVWTAVMQLVEQGRLNLDDDVNEYLEGFQLPATYPEPIRLRHLLTHTAGLEERAIGMSARSLEEQLPLAEYLERNMPARVRAPGTHAAYSNWSTSLAGYIVQQISGEPWADYLDAHVLEPLAMRSTNTHPDLAPGLAERMAKSYAWQGGRFVAKPYEYLNDEPAGVMSTTADDMTRFMLAHLQLGRWQAARILEEATARQMQSPLFAPHDEVAPFLHGFYRSDRNGQVIFGHGGDVNQFHSNLSLFPEHGLGVFVSFNSDPASAARSQLIAAFVDHFFPVPRFREAPPAAELSLDDYVGEYLTLRSNESSIERLAILMQGLEVSAVDGELSVGGQSRWIPVAEDRFVNRYADVPLVFERNGGAGVTHMMINAPLGTFRKVSGLDAPSNQQLIIALTVLIGVLAVIGYGYRLLKPGAEPRLPRATLALGWLHALLVVALFAYLGATLAGESDEFQFGVPGSAHALLLLMVANAGVGLVVIGAGFWHWQAGLGSVSGRLRYNVLGVAAALNLWVAAYFNILAYPFS